ncbi:MAG: FAD:protein FMN transferase [Bacteroidetes bacterium]|nr:FAD:protein FMN transferase [Bacteroidota bacterium]
MKSAILFFILFFISFYSYAFSQDTAVSFEMSASKQLMGTEFEITAIHGSIDSCRKAIYYAFKEIERIEKFASNYKDSTEMSYVNNNAASFPVKISFELYELIKRSIIYSELYDGYFDITVGPLTDYWGFNSDHPLKTPPDSSLIKHLLTYVGYKNLALNPNDTTISFLKKGLKIDLGGIAKGYALNRAVMILHGRGVKNFLINGGGDIYASGRKSDGSKWIIGVKDPRENLNIVKRIEVEDCAVLTSGDYERYSIINGIRYHHIFNPKNGFPARDCQSATVVMQNCEEGVMLSKILFICGKEKLPADIPYYIIMDKGVTDENSSFTKLSR